MTTEKLAKLLHATEPGFSLPWNELASRTRDNYRRQASAILERCEVTEKAKVRHGIGREAK